MPLTVAPITQATTVTPKTKDIQIIFPVKLTPASTHQLETNTQMGKVERLKRSLCSSLVSNTVQNCDNFTTNTCSLKQVENSASDDKQFTAVVKLEKAELAVNTDHKEADLGNKLLPSELDQNVKKNNVTMMEQEEDVSIENNETILIKMEPEWEDQERGKGVHGEVTQDSSHGSCTKNVEEEALKAPESDTCTENENVLLEPSKNTTESNEDLEKSSKNTTENDEDFWESSSTCSTSSSKSRKDVWEPSENTDESDEDFWESSKSSCSTKSDEDLWEPLREITRDERLLVKPSNSQPDKIEESAETQEAGDNGTKNSIYKMPRPGRLRSSHRRENTLLKLKKARGEENDEKMPREREGLMQTEFKCHCGESFKSRKEFVKHDRQYHKATMKMCEHCGEFIKQWRYDEHTRKHLPKDQIPRNYHCTICGLSYINEIGLKSHVEVVHNGKRLKCQECNKEFCRKPALKRHQLSKHMNMLNHTCMYCGKKFVSNNCMQKHMRVHTGEKPYECEYCGEKFNHNVSRKNHIRKAHPGKEIKNPAKGFSR
ncbi:uncharacterized protein LOC111125623 isoform X2 [Crassostrea virginica]